MGEGRTGARGATGVVERVEAPAEPPRSRYPLLGADGTPWWNSYFSAAARLLSPGLDPQSGEDEVRSLVAALALRPPARVLDAGCGGGRHVAALARRGFEVTGLDASPAQLEEAKRACEGSSARLLQGDLRAIPASLHGGFEAVLSLHTSFGLFSDAENEQVLRSLGECLVPGGRLLLDLHNRELVETAGKGRTWAERPGGFLLDEFGWDPDARRSYGQRILLVDGVERRFPFDHRVYSEAEVRALLKRCGLVVAGVYGSLERTPYNPRAPRMVAEAERRG